MIDRRFEIDYKLKEISLDLEINGAVFDDGISVPSLIKYFSATQGIFDKTYLTLANKSVISSKERSLFYLQTSNINQGSLLANLGMVFAASQAVLPVVSELGVSGVWEYTKSAFEFLKLIFQKNKEGFDVKIHQVDGNAHVNIGNGNQSISYIFNGPVVNIAGAALPHYEQIASGISSGKINSFSVGNKLNGEITLSKKDGDLFELPSKLIQEVLMINSEIFEFDKFSKSGKLSVFAGQKIDSGPLKFKVIGEQSSLEYIEAMLHNQVIVNCLEEQIDHPLFGKKTNALQLISVSRT